MLSAAVQDVIHAAMHDAFNRRQPESTEWHLLLALLDTHEVQVILGVQVERLRAEAEHRIGKLSVVDKGEYETAPSAGFQEALQSA